jgi:hypothetical protein
MAAVLADAHAAGALVVLCRAVRHYEAITVDEYSSLARSAICEYLPVLAAELREQPDGSLFLESRSPAGR